MPKRSEQPIDCGYCHIRPQIQDVRGAKQALQFLCAPCRALCASAKVIEACWEEDERQFIFQLTEYGQRFEAQLQQEKQ